MYYSALDDFQISLLHDCGHKDRGKIPATKGLQATFAGFAQNF